MGNRGKPRTHLDPTDRCRFVGPVSPCASIAQHADLRPRSNLQHTEAGQGRSKSRTGLGAGGQE